MADENESNDIDGQDEPMTEDEKKKYEEEKSRLLKQIEELQQFVNNAELTLNSLKYGDVQIKNKAELLNFDSELQTSSSSSQITDPNVDIENELYKMSGLYCTKSTDTEFVFNVSASSNDENNSAVQFFVEDEQITLGNWVMPFGITIDHILDETPLERPIHVIPFVRNCKRHVLCYEQRKQQFDEFKKYLSTITNCKVDTNYGYLTIFVDLLHVKNKSTNEDVNLTIYLFYNSGKVMPHTVKVDWSLKNSPSEEMTHHLRDYTKLFKKVTLEDAYKQIIEQKHSIFEWKPEIYIEKEIVLEDMANFLTEDSEEESNPDYNTKKRKRTLKNHTKKGRKTKKRDSVSPEKSTENNNNDLELSENESVTKNKSDKIPIAPKTTKIVKTKKSQGQKKLEVIRKKLSPQKIQNKVSKTKTTSDQTTIDNEKSSESPKSNKNVEEIQEKKELEGQESKTKDNEVKASASKSKSENVQKQVTVQSREQKTAKSSEKTTNISSVNTRSKQTELSFKGTPVVKIPKQSLTSFSNKKKTLTSTPMAVNVRKTRQLALNLSPITFDDGIADTKDTSLRRSPRKN